MDDKDADEAGEDDTGVDAAAVAVATDVDSAIVEETRDCECAVAVSGDDVDDWAEADAGSAGSDAAVVFSAGSGCSVVT